MTRIKVIFAALCIGLTVLWLDADRVWLSGVSFNQTRLSFLNYTGIIAMGVMAASLLLALRSTAMEPYVGGLDKSYRLHKWLGVAALVMVLVHWLWVERPSFLVSLVTFNEPVRAPNEARSLLSPALFRSVQGAAIGVGNVCFYAAVILIILALVKWIPYRRFLQTHRLLSIVYLALIFHSIVLLKASYWTYSIAYAFAALLTAGAAAAIYILFQQVGRTRQAVGKVEAITQHQDGRIVAIKVCLTDRWPGHDAGQFAFVRFKEREEPHPFTISSPWRDDGNLSFVIKGLGDYTRTLMSHLSVGSLVTIEGPYGRFNFNGPHRRQIWISAGIGITPFVSRMQHLRELPDGRIIDLFHATGDSDVRYNESLAKLAANAGVRLHVWVGAEQGRLDTERILKTVPEWKSADVWFCGPVEFGKSLQHDFRAAGLSPNDFHQELFHFR
jgi:predicted ferric reductase